MAESEFSEIEIIAEIANAHQGEPEEAFKLAEVSARAGADAVKFQIYYAEEMLVRSHPRYEHFKKSAFSEDVWNKLLMMTKGLGVKVYADVFGPKALETAYKNDVDAYKIHSSDISNTKLLKSLSTQGKKIFLSAGGTTFSEIFYAVKTLNAYKRPEKIILLHGFQAYPTKVEDTCLSRLKKLKDIYGRLISIGYMDHVCGDDRFATILPLMAIPYGIKYIEKHITMDRKAKGTDYYSSLNPDEFLRFIQDVRLAEAAIGKVSDRFSETETNYRHQVKKKWVARRAIKAGEILKESDIEMKRVDDIADTIEFEKIVGRKINCSLQADEPITNDQLDHKVMAIVVARSLSSRLPSKATLEINGKPALCHLFERLQLAMIKGYIDRIAFCTTKEISDDVLVNLASSYSLKRYRGDTDNVLGRMVLAIEDNPDCDVILRITGDDILVDPDYIKKTTDYHLRKNADYTDAKKIPSGTEVEVYNADTLKFLYRLCKDDSGTEYLTNYITDNKDQFKIASLDVPFKHCKNYRLTLDTQEDYSLIKKLLADMHACGKEYDYTLDDIINYFDKNPEKLDINSNIRQRSKPIQINTELEWRRLWK